jgi:hypothetical protein
MKFQSWHMTGDGGFYSSKGEPIRVDDVKVVIDKDKSGEKKKPSYMRATTRRMNIPSKPTT